MFELKFLSDDPTKIQLAKDYWNTNADGGWKHTVEALRQQYSLGKGRVPSAVASICVAFSSDVACPTCGKKCPLASRSEYADLQRKSGYSFTSYRHKSTVCSECREQAEVLRHLERQEQERRKEEAIINWLAAAKRQPMPYAAASTMDAFLLDGLLRYAGDAWQGNRLDPWSLHRNRLCPHILDTNEVFQRLYLGGWISPSPTSKLDAFDVDENGTVQFRALEVAWEIAPDADGISYGSLLDVTDTIVSQAPADEIAEVWRWVCLAELHEHFLHTHESYHFRSKGWTPAIQESLARLLESCSLGQAKTLIKKSFHNLAALLQQRTYSAPHVYNMLAGDIQRTFDHFTSKGWPIRPTTRPFHTVEAIYTGHLFDKILGGGTDHYNNLTGSIIKRGPGTVSIETP